MKWMKAPDGWTCYENGDRWRIRKVTLGPRPQYWIYRNHGRFSKTDSYEDSVSFFSLKEAKHFVEEEIRKLRGFMDQAKGQAIVIIRHISYGDGKAGGVSFVDAVCFDRKEAQAYLAFAKKDIEKKEAQRKILGYEVTFSVRHEVPVFGKMNEDGPSRK